MSKYIISFSNDVIPIDKIDEQQRKKINQIYSNAANDVKKQIDIIEHSSKAGTATSKLQIRRLNDLKDSIEYNIKEANGLIRKEIETNMQKVSEMTAAEYAKYLSGQRIVFNISYSRISNDIINNITSGNLYKNQYGADWNFSKRIWGDYTSAKGELSTIVVNGLATGKSAFEIAKDLEKYVTPGAKKPWDWSKVYPGCRKVIDYNAQRLARTMVSHAYQQTLVEMSKHNPYAAGIQWRSALTKRTCELCEQRHGKIFSIKNIPLDHPNGLCTYLVVLNETTDEITDELAAWINGEENKNLDEFATYLTGQDFSKISEEQKRKLIKEKEKSNVNKEKQYIPLIKNDYDADNEFRKVSEIVWSELSAEEKFALYDYTAGSSSFNMPLRGYEGKWTNFVGIEKTKGTNETAINNATNAISKSSYAKNYTLRRGIDSDIGLASFLGIKEDDLYEKSIEDLKKELVGKVVTEHGFMSCGSSENKGFTDYHSLIIQAPEGTHMMYCEPFSRYSGSSYKTSYFQKVITETGKEKDMWNGTSKQDYIGGEQEMLIQRETSFLIKDVTQNKYGCLEVLIEVYGQAY